jgi:quinol monooxygenase YgiN
MSVYSIWESRCPRERAGDGLDVTRAIWTDMLQYDGYLSHEIVEDVQDPGHLIVISRWRDRDAADAAMSYASHPNARRANDLVSEPRRRTVGLAR